DIKPIIVGGLAVEIYTRGHYTTRDIDIITPGRYEIGKFLTEELGFKKLGRSWYNEELEISIEIPSNAIDGSEDKTIKVNLPSGGTVYVIGLEDIIVHRLESATVNHRDNPEYSDDYEWAQRMFEIHKADNELIDKDYLMSASSDEKVVSIIKEWIESNQ